MQSPSLMKDPAVLAESFLPERLIDRATEMTELRRYLLPLVHRRSRRNVWVHGPPGSGKTSVVKHVLNEFEDRHGVFGVYINCWECGTWYSVLDRIIRDLRILGAERLSALFKMERLEKALGVKALVIVLDEIDKPSPRDRDTIIYNLCALTNVAVVCICNSRYYYQALDERVKSRLAVALLEFRAYATEAIREILNQRAARGLFPDTLDPQLLVDIATAAAGDARTAIQTLRQAALAAETTGVPAIQAGHVSASHTFALSVKHKYLLDKLSEHHRSIYEIVKASTEIRSAELRGEYVRRCAVQIRRPVSPRTFSLYVKQLVAAGLLHQRRALGIKGNARIFRLAAERTEGGGVSYGAP